MGHVCVIVLFNVTDHLKIVVLRKLMRTGSTTHHVAELLGNYIINILRQSGLKIGQHLERLDLEAWVGVFGVILESQTSTHMLEVQTKIGFLSMRRK